MKGRPLADTWSLGYQTATKEQVKKALGLGLTRDTVYQRVYSLNWSVEDAVSKPKDKRGTKSRKGVKQ